MPTNFDWKVAFENEIIKFEGTEISSTETSINFKMKVGEYKIDFGGTVVTFSTADGTFITKFPKLPPIFAAIIKTIMLRLK